MKPRVYVETSIVSYLTARPARDIVIAGRQQSTRDWWATASSRFELVISQLVREEAGVGDPDAATARLAALAPLTRLAFPREALELAQRRVEAVCRDSGIDPPVLCTPEELTEADEVDDEE